MRTLKDYADLFQIPLTDTMLADFEQYMRLLLDYNEKINLTAITEPEEVTIKHFLDSLLLVKAVDLTPGASLIDVGTGAGFPGIPVKIVRPDIALTLLDSLNKRLTFLSQLSTVLRQENTLIHGRAEQCAHQPELRERFDFSTARAVAALPILCEYCLPYVKVGGIFAALKGPEIGKEAEESQKTIALLGGALMDIQYFDLPLNNKRAIVLIEKRSQTLPKYPRTSVKIAKTPL